MVNAQVLTARFWGIPRCVHSSPRTGRKVNAEAGISSGHHLKASMRHQISVM
jgi:hypothetical protein